MYERMYVCMHACMHACMYVPMKLVPITFLIGGNSPLEVISP